MFSAVGIAFLQVGEDVKELFGGFSAGFYAAYRDSWPLNEGYVHRRGLYNLYHILNHANLFGGGYVSQAEQMMKALLQRAR